MDKKVVVEGRFTGPVPISPTLLDELSDEFALFADATERFTGTLYFARGGTPALEFDDVDLWRASLEKHWGEIASSTMFLGDGNRLSLDHGRGVWTLRVRAETEEGGLAALEGFAKVEGLVPVDADLFRYRRVSATYKIRDWNRADLAEGLEELIAAAGQGAPARLREAYVTLEPASLMEPLVGFHDFDTLLRKIRDPQFAFAKLFVGFEGAAGLAAGIGINVADLLMEVKTSKAPEELHEFLSPLIARLSLKLVDSAHSAGSSVAAETPPALERWWVKHVVAVAVALGVVLFQGATAGYELVITSPAPKNGVVERPDSGKLNLDWYVEPRSAILHAIDYQAAAEVIVKNDAATIERVAVPRPPYELALDKAKYKPGTYVIELRPVKDAPPRQLTLLVKP